MARIHPTRLLIFAIFLFASACKENDAPDPVMPRGTVIVYMAASNNLEEYAKKNINQMEEGLKEAGYNLLVYLNTKSGPPEVLKISHDTNPEINSEAVITYPNQNSSDPQVLKKVLTDIKERYPSDSYGLILWSHASSWMPPGSRPTTLSFGEDGGEEMDLLDLEEALPGRFEYIVFDACSMASVEVVYQLKEKTDYILASPTETLASGMPYHIVIPHFFEGKAGLEQVADKYVDYYSQQDGLRRSATVSLIDTRELPGLAARSKEVLEGATFADPDYSRDEVQRLDFESPPATESYDFLHFFQQNLPAESLQPLTAQLEKTVLFKHTTSEFLGEPIEAFSGLSCYIPHRDDDYLNDYYKTLEWSQASGFDLLIDRPQ